MQTPESPPKMSVCLLIILGIVTLTIFFPIWFLIRKNWLNRLSATKKLGSRLGIYVLFIWIIPEIMLLMPLGMQAYETWERVNILGTLSGGACIVILAFQVRRILIQHYNENLGMNIGFSGAATFFFQGWYLQYKINRLPISVDPVFRHPDSSNTPLKWRSI
jgi:hypothetical protein